MELLPIKFFSKREEDKQRVEGNSSKELPKWVLTGSELERRTVELGMNLDSVISSVQWENRNTPLLMQAKLNKDAHAKSHRRKIEALFSTRENNVVGLGSEDALIVKISTLSDVEQIRSKLNDKEKNAYGISGIVGFEKYTPIIEKSEDISNYKIKLFNFRDYSVNVSNCKKMEQLLESRNIKYVRSKYAKSLIIFKLCSISDLAVDDLLQQELFDIAEEVIPMPSFDLGLDSVSISREIEIK